MPAKWPSDWPVRRFEDAAEDAAHGSTRRGDEPPDWMRDKQARLARIRAAKAELEAEAQQAEAARPPPPCDPDGNPKPRPDRVPKHPPGQPKPKVPRNFTDPESRIMKGRDGFIQAYNAQAAVDADAQIIVAHRLTNNGSDQDALLALLDAVAKTTGGHSVGCQINNATRERFKNETVKLLGSATPISRPIATPRRVGLGGLESLLGDGF